MIDQWEEERRWIARALDGDHRAFTEIIENYKNQVFGLAYRMLGNREDAEDASQEIFLRVYTKLGTYDSSKRFATWLMSVASNYCIDRLRRRRPQVPIDDMTYMLKSGAPGPEREALNSEDRREVQRALEQLPDIYRLVTVLRYWNDLSYTEICEVTGLSESAVKTRLHRARKMLADTLEAGGYSWTAEPSAH